MENTTIKFTKNQRELIGKAAEKAGKNMGEYAYQCVFFVDKHRYDPYNLEDIMIVEEFKKLKNQLISFIRKQEQDYITPMINGLIDVKKELIAHKGILQAIQVNTAEVEGIQQKDSIENVKMVTESSLQGSELKRLEDALRQKDEMLKKAYSALQALKKASLEEKNQVIIRLNPVDFNKLVSLI
jgi:hypothetical protein